MLICLRPRLVSAESRRVDGFSYKQTHLGDEWSIEMNAVMRGITDARDHIGFLVSGPVREVPDF